MKMIFLVDGDNNIGTGLQGIDLLTAEDTVLVFFGKGQTLANVKKLCAGTKAQVQYLESVKGGKNSLDFQIITELGVLVGRGEADFAYVISQDKGYEAAMSALHARYASTFREVALRPSIQDCLQAAFLLRAGTREELAAALARQFSVSRQIIVGDIALLRAAGADISATPRGYVILRETGGLVRQVAVQHDAAGMGEELNAMVDQGCTVLDVIVDHPIYGQLTGPLQLSNRYDVGQFLSRCAQSDARPLSELTEGIHLHTLSCPDEAAFGRVCRELRRLGVLLEG